MMRATRNRRLAAGLFFVYLSLSVAEDAAVSEQSQDMAGHMEVSGTDSVTYDAIEGMMLESHGTVVKNETKDRCQLMCSESAKCKSFSYSESGKVCVVSDDSLTYDPAFVFEAKAIPEDKVHTKEEFHSFEGLTYKPEGWSKISGKTIAQCKALCSKAAACKAFSYRQRDESCLLSEKGIEYSSKFTYYEKNKPSMSSDVTMQNSERERKLGEGQSKDLGASQGSVGDQASEDAALQAQQKAEQQESNNADVQALQQQAEVNAAASNAKDTPQPAGPLSSDPVEAKAQGYKQGYSEGVKASTSPKADDPFSNEKLQKLERRVKYKAKVARMAIYEAKETQKEGNKTMAIIQEETKKKIDAIKAGDKDKLKKLEEDFKAKEEESFEKKKNAEQVQFAQQELRTKVQVNQDKLDQIKLDALKKQDEIKEKSDEKARQTLLQAQSAAAVETKKLEVAAALKETQEKLAESKANTEKQEKLKVKFIEQTASLKEASTKHTQKVAEKMEAFRSSAEAQEKVDKVRNEKQIELVRIHANEVSQKKAGASESQQGIMNTESAEKRAEAAKVKEQEAKKALQNHAEAMQKQATTSQAVQEKQNALSAETVEAMRQHDEIEATLKAALEKQKADAEKAIFDNAAQQKQATVATKEANEKKIAALRATMAARERVFNQAVQRDTENAKKIAMKKAMDKASVYVNTRQEQADSIAAKATQLKEGWYGNGADQGKKQEGRVQRTNQENQLKTELKNAQDSTQTRLDQARAAAAEVQGKAKQNAEMSEAKAEARYRMIKAGAVERAEKIPSQRAETEKRNQGIIYIDIKASVATFTDSGVDRVGVNNFNKLKNAFVTAKMSLRQTTLVADDADLEYNLAEQKRDKLFKNVNETLQRRLDDAAKVRDSSRNESQVLLTELRSKLDSNEDFNALQGRLEQLKNDNPSVANALNVSRLVVTTPLPPPPPTGGPSPVSGRRLLMSDVNEDVTSLSEVEPTSLIQATETLGPPSALTDGYTESTGIAVTQPSCQLKSGKSGQCKPGYSSGSPPPQHLSSGATYSCTNGGTPFKQGNTCTPRDGQTTAVQNTPDGCFYKQSSSWSHEVPLAPATDGSGDTQNCVFQQMQGWKCKSGFWRLPNDEGIANNNYKTTPKSKYFHPCSDKNKFASKIQGVQDQANEIFTKSVKIKEMQDQIKQAQNRMQNANSVYNAKEETLRDNFGRSVKALDGRLMLVEAAKNASSVKVAAADAAFTAATAAFNGLSTEKANTAQGSDPAKASVLELQKSADHDRDIYLQFPSSILKKDDTITKAHLKMYKVGGDGGPVIVKAAGCHWTRGTLTYTGARNLAYARVSSGTTATIPNDNNQWTNIELKGDVIERSRTNGEHICLQITGGPAMGASVFDSEQTQNVPILSVETKTPTDAYGLQYGSQKNVFVAEKVKPNFEMTEQELCRARIKREIVQEFTDKILRKKKKGLVKKIQEIKLEAGVDVDSEDILGVMTMQVDAANLASANVGSQAGAIKKNIRVVVSKQLTAMANMGASADDIAIATEKLRNSAVADASRSAGQSAGQIQKKTNEALLEEEKKLQAEQERAKAAAEEKEADARVQSRTLTGLEKAAMMVDVDIELARRAQICQKIKPGDLESAESVKGGVSESRVESL